MADKIKRPKVDETPSERFDRVAKRVLERDRRYLERLETRNRQETSGS